MTSRVFRAFYWEENVNLAGEDKDVHSSYLALSAADLFFRPAACSDYDFWSPPSRSKELVGIILHLSHWEHAWAAEDGAVDCMQAVGCLARICEEWMNWVSTKSL
ncbi:hypothetical protein EV121DRAFT_298138 [Schizophyllum commune]